MKAITYKKFGPPEVLKLQKVARPEPKANEILVKVKATTVNYGDLVARNFKNISLSQFHMPAPLLLASKLYFGLRKPRVKILGSEFAGVVTDLGQKVGQFKKGDEVFGYLGPKMGAYGEYLVIAEDKTVTKKPKNMTFDQAAGLAYGALMAINHLRKVKIAKGANVLVNGASGSIGAAAVQLAKHHFEAEVTGVCSTARLDYVKELGADQVIDYTKEDFTQNGQKYDLIYDILGKSSFGQCQKVLKKNGRYLLASFKTPDIFQMLRTAIWSPQGNLPTPHPTPRLRMLKRLRQTRKVICAFASEKQKDLVFIKKLAEAGKIKAFIDKQFPREEAAQAHRYVEEGRKKGSVVISFSPQKGDNS